MKKIRLFEFTVGLFMIAGMLILTVLAVKVSGLTLFNDKPVYHVTAHFSDIGSLKARAPVTVAGVRIGQISRIELDNKSFTALVTMDIDAQENNLPVDSTASILTEGLLGSNYINIAPGFEEAYLKDNSEIESTNPAIRFENLLGQLIFNIKKEDKPNE